MKKKLFTILAVLGLFLTVSNAQEWTSYGAFPDTSFNGGTHGLAVDPDGKVWVASFFKDVDWATPDQDTIATAGIYVFNPDGTQAPFSPITHVISNNGFTIDTLSGNCRGMGVDENGNILYVSSSSSYIIKINYQTGEGLGSVYVYDDLGTSPTAPSVADDGTIFLGPVVGNGLNNIVMYDKDLNYLGNAATKVPKIARTLEVSKDGNTIYWMPFTGLKTFVYNRADEFSSFELTDSIHTGMSIESSTWHPTTGDLWISNDSRGDAQFKHLTWYSYNVETKELTEEFTWLDDNGSIDELPRGIDFSPDGTIAYVGTYDVGSPRIQKFENKMVGIQEIDNGIVPEGYALEQNYPNPFNPTTNIKFQIAKEELVVLKVFNMLGQEVAELHNDFTEAGTYEVKFDASNLASGVYVYTLKAGKFFTSKKMSVIK